MRQNYRGNKKRIEETKRKRKEEKRNRRLGKNEAVSGAPPEETPPILPETTA